jgi:hypothetical protein
MCVPCLRGLRVRAAIPRLTCVPPPAQTMPRMRRSFDGGRPASSNFREVATTPLYGSWHGPSRPPAPVHVSEHSSMSVFKEKAIVAGRGRWVGSPARGPYTMPEPMTTDFETPGDAVPHASDAARANTRTGNCAASHSRVPPRLSSSYSSSVAGLDAGYLARAALQFTRPVPMMQERMPMMQNFVPPVLPRPTPVPVRSEVQYELTPIREYYIRGPVTQQVQATVQGQATVQARTVQQSFLPQGPAFAPQQHGQRIQWHAPPQSRAWRGGFHQPMRSAGYSQPVGVTSARWR